MRLPGWNTVFCLFILCGAASAAAALEPAGVFGDHMVLQRGMSVSVWGFADADTEVTVRFAGQEKRARSGSSGRWEVRLDAMKASEEGRELTMSDGRDVVLLRDVVVGDVWLCSGQSNMGFPLGASDAEEDIREADLPNMRICDVRMDFAYEPREDCEASWRVCSPDTAGSFAAVPFYFGRELAGEIGVPIGLLHSSVGGTNIELWMSHEAVYDYPKNRKLAENLEERFRKYDEALPGYMETMRAWMDEAQDLLHMERRVPPPPQAPEYPVGREGSPRILALYNGMIHPIRRFAIKGSIWYQGENNWNDGRSYVHKQSAMIDDWRNKWGQGAFPFYYVQLASWQEPNSDPAGGDGWAEFRWVQAQCMERIPNSGMASAIDVGAPDDIHPKNKADVGRRLALWALARDYGRDVVPSGPLYKRMEAEEGRIRLHFEYVGTGLTAGRKNGREVFEPAPGGELRMFAIAGEDRQWRWAEARIDGDTVLVFSEAVPKPVAVRYAYAMNVDAANLYNAEGLPASPFRTDDW